MTRKLMPSLNSAARFSHPFRRVDLNDPEEFDKTVDEIVFALLDCSEEGHKNLSTSRGVGALKGLGLKLIKAIAVQRYQETMNRGQENPIKARIKLLDIEASPKDESSDPVS